METDTNLLVYIWVPATHSILKIKFNDFHGLLCFSRTVSWQ